MCARPLKIEQTERRAAGESEEERRIASILSGNRREFHDLIRPYERRAYAMALSMTKNEADAEEIVQEAFLKAFRGLHSFRAQSRFSTWLLSITMNEARNWLRRRNALKVESLDDSGDEHQRFAPALLRDWREIPSETLERLEMRRILQEAITGLPFIYREVLILRDIEELSVSESAEALGISETSVKVRLHRARMMLQKKLAPQLERLSPKRRWFAWS